MLTISEENRYILLLEGCSFFQFIKTKNFNTNTFISFEAERFCFLYNECLCIPTHNLLSEFVELKRTSYSSFYGELCFLPSNIMIGKFLNNQRKKIAASRLIAILNIKTNFQYSIPEELYKRGKNKLE